MSISKEPSRHAPVCHTAARLAVTFRTLLYRYFFFSWLFRDVSRGNLFERAAAWRHNRSQAHWLPVYMRRWLVGGLGLFVAGCTVELLLAAPVLSVLFYVPSVVSVSIEALIVVAWLGLKALPEPF
jgi:hypothetical protein